MFSSTDLLSQTISYSKSIPRQQQIDTHPCLHNRIFVVCCAGKLGALQSSGSSLSPADASAALDALLSDLTQKLQHSVAMLGGPDSPAAAALQAALLPISGTAASIQAALSQPDHSAGDGGGFDVAGLLDQLVSAVGSASSSLADGVGAATAQVVEMKAAARTLVAAEGVCGALEEVMVGLKQQMAASSSSSTPEAAEESANLLRATADEVVAQLEQLRLTGLASMEDDDDGAATAAALDGLLAAIQAKAEELAGQVQAGQMKGTAALEEVRLVWLYWQ